MKAIFLGTSWESVETLEILHAEPFFEIVCVITSPDKPVGRKQLLTPTDVKKYAEDNNIPVEHTGGKREKYIEISKKYRPEIVICKAFGEIIPKEFIEYPKYGCINIHFSILPKYRGAVPIQKAILDGEKETGITVMLMNEKLDEGDIIKIYKEKIKKEDTNITLRKRLVRKTKEVLIPTLKQWIKGEVKASKQDNSKATYCWEKDVSKERAEIIWDAYEPEYIERMIRAFLPWPVAWTRLDYNNIPGITKKRIKIFEANLVNLRSNRKPGELFSKEQKIFFATKDPFKTVRIKSFQIEGKQKTNEKEFLNGMRGLI